MKYCDSLTFDGEVLAVLCELVVDGISLFLLEA